TFLYTNKSSQILALAIATLLDLPAEPWSNRSDSDALLVLPDPAALDRMDFLPVQREDCGHIFCFQVFPLQTYPLLPEIIGLLANRFRFPWEERVEVYTGSREETKAIPVPADQRDGSIIASEIAEAAEMLPVYDKAHELISFYKNRRNLLVCGNLDRFPLRRHFDPFYPARK
ncbi:MAG: hypothetical protein KJ645_04345, partial [Planctomycetes bacterium]|nr:hypothetical protein [Planctomycetota bacterium]